jgi:cytoskeletal protein RodZ
MSKSQVTTIVILLATTLMIGGVVIVNNNQKQNNEQSSVATTSSSKASGNSDAKATSSEPGSYKAGEYSAAGDYESPDGAQKIIIKLTIQSDGTITDTSATENANGRESSEYQARFISGYKSQVVGKDIDSLTLDSVSGSSLTPQGFNDALDKIKENARA